MPCDCSIDVDNNPEFMTSKIITARKFHKCCECHEEIKPGEKYERVSGKWEGEMSTIRTCLICAKIRADYCPDGFEFGMLCEILRECLGFDYITGEGA
jgi:hypothetical protein